MSLDIKVDHFIHTTPDSSGAILTLLQTIKAQGDQIMSGIADVAAEVAIVKQALADSQGREAAAFAALQANAAALQATVDQLKAAQDDPAVVAQVLADLQSVVDSLNAEAPAPAPAPAPSSGETPVP